MSKLSSLGVLILTRKGDVRDGRPGAAGGNGGRGGASMMPLMLSSMVGSNVLGDVGR